jgi:hypothetical protein
MTLWLYDLSNHQSSTPSLNGWDGVIAKASEGSGFKDVRFRQHIDAARNAGKIHAGYHFLRSDVSVKSQFENFASVCPRDIAAIPDIESHKDRSGRVVSAPTPQQAAEFTDRLLQAGYNVPMHYLPPWYWSGPVGNWNRAYIGDWCTYLWPSWYPDYTARPRETAWRMVPNSVRLPFGGAKAVPLVQFTSSPLDQNASEWSFEDLYALFAGRAPGGGQGEKEVGYDFSTQTLPASTPDEFVGDLWSEDDILIPWQEGATNVQAVWVTLHGRATSLDSTGNRRPIYIKYAHWVGAEGNIVGEFLPQDSVVSGYHWSSGGQEAPNDAKKLTIVYRSPLPLKAGVESVTQ